MSAAAARPSWGWPLHQTLDHHQGIDKTQLPVAKRPGQRADHLKAIALPAADASGVGAHHQVELHRSEPQPPRRLQGVLAQPAADSLAPAVLGHHVARIGHMGAEGRELGLR
jgi:hypothetical protein